MKILNRLPISRADTFAFVGTEGVRLKKEEIIVWVSLSTVSAARPLFLELPGGVAVFPDGEASPRLPLFGLRAILSNNLPLRVDGEHASVTLRTPDWRTRLLSWLA